MNAHSHINIGAQVAKLKQERDELAAQVEVMMEAINDAIPFIGYQAYVPHIISKNEAALSITPYAALREIQARTLEEAAKQLWEDGDTAKWLEQLAAAKRKGE